MNLCSGRYPNYFSSSALRGISTVSKSGINRFINERLRYLLLLTINGIKDVEMSYFHACQQCKVYNTF